MVSKNGVRNILFDFGAVLLNIDYSLTIQAFEKLGIKDFQSVFSKESQSQLIDRLETGKASPEEFRNAIRPHLTTPSSDQQIDAAWNALLLDLPQDRLALVEQLKKRYEVGLLSNTNRIHAEQFTKNTIEVYGKNVLTELFDRLYYSHEIGMRKPHSETFLKTCEMANFSPSETLFIDDTPRHVEGAIKAGLKAYHLKEGEDICEILADF